jgi:hypothetical protein
MRAAVGTNIPPNELRKQMRAFDAQAFLDSAGVARTIAEYPKSEKKNYVKTAMQFPSHAVTDTIRSTPMRPPFARRVSIGTETPGAQSLARPLTTSSSAIDASASCMEGPSLSAPEQFGPAVEHKRRQQQVVKSFLE